MSEMEMCWNDLPKSRVAESCGCPAATAARRNLTCSDDDNDISKETDGSVMESSL